jgi:hypothetical protein
VKAGQIINFLTYVQAHDRGEHLDQSRPNISITEGVGQGSTKVPGSSKLWKNREFSKGRYLPKNTENVKIRQFTKIPRNFCTTLRYTGKRVKRSDNYSDFGIKFSRLSFFHYRQRKINNRTFP